ncbi:MAG: helix-turn-helix domain-containing protein [Lachnospiraceae bacterium]
MILADKITEERKKNGWSQEELADKLGVSRQAVSKWESAGAVPDLQRIIQLSELFSVSTDYLLKDEMEVEASSDMMKGINEDMTLRKVSMEEANEFLDMKRKGAPSIANAVSVCIISPALLIFLSGMAESGVAKMTEGMAAGVGMIFLFVMVALAVFTFITYGIRESRMEHFEKENFETAYGVTGMVKEKRRDYEGTFARGISFGVVFCILAALPLIIAGTMGASDFVCCSLVGLLLLMVASGVNMMIRVGMIKSSYDTLLQEGEFSAEEKLAKKKSEPFAGAYWCLVTAIYLGWSFWTMNWSATWIVWPVAGVLFAALSAIFRIKK